MSAQTGDIRTLAGDIEVWNGVEWCVGLRGCGTDTGTIYLMGDDFTRIQRRSTMSITERTVTINHVTLTEAQLREGLRQLEQPTLGSIKAGTYFTCDYDRPDRPRLRLKLHPSGLLDKRNGVVYLYVDNGAPGYLAWDLADCPVRVVRGEFHAY